MRRVNRNVPFLILILCGLLIIFLFFNNYSKSPDGGLCNITTPDSASEDQITFRKFRCLVEGIRPLQCVRLADEVYLPFNKFLKKQFDLSGKLNKDNFEYYTSYSKVRIPDESTYDAFGPFGHFGSYNVEIRERVKCINAARAVPMSVQWDSTPYFYPVQIAQFALQHYSRYKTDAEPKAHQLPAQSFELSDVKQTKTEDGEGSIISIPDGDTTTVKLNSNADFPTLTFSWQPRSQGSWFEVNVQLARTKQNISLKYVRSQTNGFGECVWFDPSSDFNAYDEDEVRGRDKELSFIYSLGSVLNTSKRWDVVLDLVVDASKALALLHLQRRENGHPIGLKNGDVRLINLTFRNAADLSLPLKQRDKINRELFLKSSEWLIENQDGKGGWPVPVERVIADGRLVLKAGWVSAMAQGHALSVLVRAYNLTEDARYLESATKALSLFRINAADGGVANKLFGYDWFEEYPTQPGTFVLNGFLYALIGLWDASNIPQLRNESTSLLTCGLESLRQFLPLFDTGDGSVYDLRHVGLKTAPNLARWDYHAVHVYLLKWLHNISGEKYLNEVAIRWMGYAHGKKAKHN